MHSLCLVLIREGEWDKADFFYYYSLKSFLAECGLPIHVCQ